MSDRLGNLAVSPGSSIHKKFPPLVSEQDRFSVGSELMDECAREAALELFPNDLTRMVYLASLRDCNSGRYLHPTLSPRIGIEMAHQALRDWHFQVFWRLLVLPLSRYVGQLEEYIRYTRAEERIVLETWQCLQAYRATTPIHGAPLYRELFCLNVESALLILQTRSGMVAV